MGSSGPQCRTVCISTGLHCSWNTGSRCPVSARWADWAGRCPAAPEAFATAYPELESHSLHRLTPSKCTQASFCLRLRAGIWEAGVSSRCRELQSGQGEGQLSKTLRKLSQSITGWICPASCQCLACQGDHGGPGLWQCRQCRGDSIEESWGQGASWWDPTCQSLSSGSYTH